MARPRGLEEYDTVAGRLRAFYARHPAGSVRTELIERGTRVIFAARVYRDPTDPHPVTGWAYDLPDSDADPGIVTANCEAAAVGRALANLGITGPRRPSREEMAKVLRLSRRR